MTVARSFIIQTNARLWAEKVVSRKARLARLQEMNAPDLIIDFEKGLIRKARAELYKFALVFDLSYDLLGNSTWEIDIVSGEIIYDHPTTEATRIGTLLLHLNDDSLEEE